MKIHSIFPLATLAGLALTTTSANAAIAVY